MKNKFMIAILLVLTFSGANAQKIKYKDLFPTLDAKNWEAGESQLRTYLSDPKNAEEANAHLQMAMMLEEYFLKMDIVADSTNAYSKGDSAIQYYKLAKELITEKELKKHDEYYKAFYRRDLRTGEFGIKMSDVHLDIEKKIETIEQKIDEANTLKKKTMGLERQYKKIAEIYQKLVADYGDYSTLLLAAKKEDVELIQQIRTDGVRTFQTAKEIKESAQNLGSSEYQGEIELKTIDKFGEDGVKLSGMQSGAIEMWNYTAWAAETFSEINGSVSLLKSMIMQFATTIREQKRIIKKGTDSEVDTLTRELIDLFGKYEEESVAKRLLYIESSEVLIMKNIDIFINKELQDSTLIGTQLSYYQRALDVAKKMNVVLSSITPEELVKAKKTYEDYINSFFQHSVTVSNFVNEKREWVKRQEKWLQDAVDYWSEQNKWGTDEKIRNAKIPLFVQESPESEFFTIGRPVFSNEKIVVYGANMAGKKGYIYGFGPDRVATWKLQYDLPGKANYQLRADTLPVPDDSFGFFLLNAAEKAKNLSLVSFKENGTLNWSVVVTAKKPPVDFRFDAITNELTVLFYPEDELPLDSGELGYIVIDRTGNAR